MPKILMAHGDPGNHGQDWNWCEDAEPVGYHGFVCDNTCSCGCGRSFIGTRSAKATTQVVVREVSDQEFLEMRNTLWMTTLAFWGGSERVAKEALAAFDDLSLNLEQFKDGDVLRVNKLEDPITLTPA
jgi:hypothetical protein